ncbi:hypothetical protein BpHYR1_040219 [Brachionus plicatilis]|uniref:Uncharacterized protein n=1 Tax=Brachionus plicatilis TaxID=10195 RepID=A0A3M7S1C1_BRAPC|nr:hypothetical protein BpHYR1_040219 [Brachionus plicatilis]
MSKDLSRERIWDSLNPKEQFKDIVKNLLFYTTAYYNHSDNSIYQFFWSRLSIVKRLAEFILRKLFPSHHNQESCCSSDFLISVGREHTNPVHSTNEN